MTPDVRAGLRWLTPALQKRRRERGLTLMELAVAFVIIALLAAVGVPSLAEYSQNARLRESGNNMLVEALYAQNEAIKRNGVVRLTLNGNNMQVWDRSGEGDPVLLRERPLGEGVSVDAAVTVNFGSTGRLSPLGATVDPIGISRSGSTCSTDIRCPALRVESGGAVRLCPNKAACT